MSHKEFVKMKIPQDLSFSGMEYGRAKGDSSNAGLMTGQFSSHVCAGSYLLCPKYPILFHLVSLVFCIAFKITSP